MGSEMCIRDSGYDAQRAWLKCMERSSTHGNTLTYCESCSSSVENLVLALHCVAQSNAYYLSQILYNDCLVMGAFEQRVGCFWRRSLSQLDCIPGKKMDDMLMCCILVMIC